jgi:hypothetical protein
MIKMAIKTAKELVAKCKEVAKNYKTLYVMGCFGAPLNASNKTRYCNNHSYNKQASRTKKIKAASADTFGFDCVCLIKGLLWGWNGNTAKTYGGASYNTNGVPDINADQMIQKCQDVSTDFSNIQAGEIVWMEGHVGVYIGDGLAVECTPIWKDGVQITAVHNIGKKSGYNGRKWTKHGKLPYVTYEAVKPVTKPATNTKDTKIDSVLEVQTWLNNNYASGLTRDGLYGSRTKAALVKALQKELGFTGKDVDGDYGKKTNAAVQKNNLRRGDKGDLVKVLQGLLVCNGYKDAYVDGSFGGGTESAVKEYQRKKGLTVDGVAGSGTFTALCA